MDASIPFGPVGGATSPNSLRGSVADPGSFFLQPVPNQAEAFRRIRQAHAGLPIQAVRELMTLLELTNAETARLLALPLRTLTRHLRQAEPLALALAPDEAERVLLLRELSARGAAIFADQGKFNRWLRRPLPVLENQAPLTLLDTATGLQLVEQVLGRLAYGVYS